MAGLIGQYQQGAFSTPTNGTQADASVVLANDNNVRTKHNSHDNDSTIHVQSSVLASRPGAGTAQRVWITTDGLRAYIDDGANWDELAYLPLVGGTMTGHILFTDATYDIGASGATRPRDLFLSRNAVIGGTLAVTGVATLTAQPILSSLTASQAVFTDGSKGLVSNAITGSGSVVMSASPTLSGTIGGALTFSGALTLSSALTYGGVTLSNAVTGTGSMVLSTAPSFTSGITVTGDAKVGATNAFVFGAVSTGNITRTTVTPVAGATNIAASTASDGHACLALVSGRVAGGGNPVFAELVLWIPTPEVGSGSHSVITQVTANSPSDRTYSISGANLRLAMTSGSYDISVINIDTNRG